MKKTATFSWGLCEFLGVFFGFSWQIGSLIHFYAVMVAGLTLKCQCFSVQFLPCHSFNSYHDINLLWNFLVVGMCALRLSSFCSVYHDTTFPMWNEVPLSWKDGFSVLMKLFVCWLGLAILFDLLRCSVWVLEGFVVWWKFHWPDAKFFPLLLEGMHICNGGRVTSWRQTETLFK